MAFTPFGPRMLHIQMTLSHVSTHCRSYQLHCTHTNAENRAPAQWNVYRLKKWLIQSAKLQRRVWHHSKTMRGWWGYLSGRAPSMQLARGPPEQQTNPHYVAVSYSAAPQTHRALYEGVGPLLTYSSCSILVTELWSTAHKTGQVLSQTYQIRHLTFLWSV